MLSNQTLNKICLVLLALLLEDVHACETNKHFSNFFSETHIKTELN